MGVLPPIPEISAKPDGEAVMQILHPPNRFRRRAFAAQATSVEILFFTEMPLVCRRHCHYLTMDPGAALCC